MIGALICCGRLRGGGREAAGLLAVLHERLSRPAARDLATVAVSTPAELSSEEGSGDDTAAVAVEAPGGFPAITAHIARMGEVLESGRPAKRRTLKEYHELLDRVGRAHKAYLMQDVFDEMQLDGVAPSWESFGMALSTCLCTKSLAPAHHFFREMQRRGFHPTIGTLSVVVATAGHAGQLRYALRLVEQMQERQIPINDKVQRSLLSCYASTRQSRSAMALLDEFIMTRTRLDVHLFMETIRSVRVDATNAESPAARAEAAAHIETVLVKAMEHLDLEGSPGDRDCLLMSAQDAYNRLGMFEAARDAFENMVDPDPISLRSHFASFLEEARMELEKGQAADTEKVKYCFGKAISLLLSFEERGVQLRLFHTAGFVMAAVELERLIGGEAIRVRAPDGGQLDWSVLQMCMHLVKHTEKNDQFISIAYGSRMIKTIALGRRRLLVPLADAIFDNMAAKGDMPGRGACSQYAIMKRQLDPEDLERIDKAIHMAKAYRPPKVPRHGRNRRAEAEADEADERLDWEPSSGRERDSDSEE